MSVFPDNFENSRAENSGDSRFAPRPEIFCAGRPHGGDFSAPLATLSRRGFLRLAVAAPLALCAAISEGATSFKGVDYTPLSKLAKLFGMKCQTLEFKKKQRVYGKSVSLNFEIHRRDMYINGRKIWLGAPVIESKSMLYIPTLDIEKTLTPILYPQKIKNPPALKRIVIDPGHGGKDKGATNKNLYEKFLTLDISARLAKILRAKGYQVALTRNRDVFLELPTRPAFANANGADLFVSVHINSAVSSAPSGVETFALSPAGLPSTSSAAFRPSDARKLTGNDSDPWNVLAAYYVQKSLKDGTNALDRGVKRARFAVLQTSKAPAILVECGFISNPSESAKLATPNYRESIAQSIAAGLSNYGAMLSRVRQEQQAQK